MAASGFDVIVIITLRRLSHGCLVPHKVLVLDNKSLVVILVVHTRDNERLVLEDNV